MVNINADEYIEKQQSPQKEILCKLRTIFQTILPDHEETMSWGVITFAEGKFYLAAMKNRVHVGFAINGLSKEEIDFFEGNGKTMRHIKINSVEDIDEKRLGELILLVKEKATCNPC